MNSFTVNSAALNAEGSLASIVHIPTANCYIAVDMYEGMSAEISGDIQFSMDALGDITSFISPGTGLVEITIEVTGNLSIHQTVYFGVSEIPTSIILTGNLAAKIIGPYGECFTNTDLIGELLLTQVFTGNTDFDFSLSGDALNSHNLSVAESFITIEPTGTLRLSGGLFGNTDFTISATGDMTQGIAKYFDASAASFGFDSISDITQGVANYFSSSNVDLNLGLTGVLRFTGGLLGDALWGLDSSASMTQGISNYFEPSNIVTYLENTGTLRLTGGLFGNALWNLTPSADLTKDIPKYFDQSNGYIYLENTGTIRLSGGLFGNTLSASNLEGVLTKQIRSYLPTSVVQFKIDNSAYLSGILRVQGESIITINATSTLSKLISMLGNSVCLINVYGSLSNNLGGMDLEKLLMYRPKTNKEMTR